MISQAEYHSLPSLSSSKIRDFLTEGPRVYEARHIARTVKVKETADMRTGTAAQAILSGVGSVVKIPDEALTSNGQRRGKAWEQFAEENAGKTLVKPDEWGELHRIVSAVRNHPLAGRLYAAEGQAEVVYQWKDLTTGLDCRAMLDWQCVLDGNPWVVDLKVSSGRTPREWTPLAAKAHYHVQQEWYRTAYDLRHGVIPRFVFCVVPPDPPHVVRLYAFKSDEVVAARHQINQATMEIAERTASGDWSDEGEFSVTPIELPKWAKEVKHVDDSCDHGTNEQRASGERTAASAS